MTGKGGAAPGRKGSRFEALVVADQLARGRAAYRLRQGGGCVVDVLAVEHCQDGHCSLYGSRVAHVFLIQAKVDGHLPGAERAALVAAAAKVDAIPLLAVRVDGGVRYELLADPEGTPADGDDLRDTARDARERDD